jgi:hypothetical protein
LAFEEDTVWDQVRLEQLHSRAVDSLDLSAWETILGLQRAGPEQEENG